MSDNYQAVYDAVRSRIHNGNVGQAVEQVAREAFDISFQMGQLQQFASEQFAEWGRPSVVYRPTLSRDGDHWCALLGDNLQEGLGAFGETPAKAMAAFDLAFYNERAKQ